MKPHSIASVNKLDIEEKRRIYTRFIPPTLLERFKIAPSFHDDEGNDLLRLRCEAGTTDVEIDLRHKTGAEDPLLYTHLADTVNGQIHVLLYVVNDPNSSRFDVDRMPDGAPTQFGIFRRNLEAEKAAMNAGLAPGQVRSGLRILKHSIASFEVFVSELGHDLFFSEPLHYHNAVVFERYGFAYLQGRWLMEQINQGFMPGEEYYLKLDRSTPFRVPANASCIRGRSWAIHDGILGQAYDKVTMYKSIGHHAGINTYPNGEW
ncbi:MAG: hypothetical protein GTO18_02625 [Anaerolineales bacterium]|nr:hypothetical protein [Anaerolineales bacterium]